jgi:hypothetical protein
MTCQTCLKSNKTHQTRNLQTCLKSNKTHQTRNQHNPIMFTKTQLPKLQLNPNLIKPIKPLAHLFSLFLSRTPKRNSVLEKPFHWTSLSPLSRSLSDFSLANFPESGVIDLG